MCLPGNNSPLYFIRHYGFNLSIRVRAVFQGPTSIGKCCLFGVYSIAEPLILGIRNNRVASAL